MSCAEGTGCECGVECADDLTSCAESVPMALACRVCGGPIFPVTPCRVAECPQRIIG